MAEIYIRVKEATFTPASQDDSAEPIKIPSTSDVKLLTFENDRFHRHYYGYRHPTLVFQWLSRSLSSFGDQIWETFGDLAEHGAVSVIDEQGKRLLCSSCNMRIWNNGDSPTLEFKLHDGGHSAGGIDRVVLDTVEEED